MKLLKVILLTGLALSSAKAYSNTWGSVTVSPSFAGGIDLKSVEIVEARVGPGCVAANEFCPTYEVWRGREEGTLDYYYFLAKRKYDGALFWRTARLGKTIHPQMPSLTFDNYGWPLLAIKHMVNDRGIQVYRFNGQNGQTAQLRNFLPEVGIRDFNLVLAGKDTSQYENPYLFVVLSAFAPNGSDIRNMIVSTTLNLAHPNIDSDSLGIRKFVGARRTSTFIPGAEWLIAYAVSGGNATASINSLRFQVQPGGNYPRIVYQGQTHMEMAGLRMTGRAKIDQSNLYFTLRRPNPNVFEADRVCRIRANRASPPQYVSYGPLNCSLTTTRVARHAASLRIQTVNQGRVVMHGFHPDNRYSVSLVGSIPNSQVSSVTNDLAFQTIDERFIVPEYTVITSEGEEIEETAFIRTYASTMKETSFTGAANEQSLYLFGGFYDAPRKAQGIQADVLSGFGIRAKIQTPIQGAGQSNGP